MIPHGIKRPAHEGLEKEQRLTKRLGRLSLGERIPSWPVACPKLTEIDGNGLGPVEEEEWPPRSRKGDVRTDHRDDGHLMQLDDTRYRVYISDLEDELSSDDSKDDPIVFLPQIERRLTKIPRSVMASSSPAVPSTNRELVLYRVPTSSSYPDETDSVRRVIMETRARAQELQAKRARESERGSDQDDGHHVKPTVVIAEDIEDPDAMEIE